MSCSSYKYCQLCFPLPSPFPGKFHRDRPTTRDVLVDHRTYIVSFCEIRHDTKRRTSRDERNHWMIITSRCLRHQPKTNSDRVADHPESKLSSKGAAKSWVITGVIERLPCVYFIVYKWYGRSILVVAISTNRANCSHHNSWLISF